MKDARHFDRIYGFARKRSPNGLRFFRFKKDERIACSERRIGSRESFVRDGKRGDRARSGPHHVVYAREGGIYIPTCDHGVPEEVEFEDYLHFRRRLLEFAH